MDLKIKAVSPKIGKDIPLPFYATPGSAAMDLHACVDEAVTIPAGGRRTIPTGIAIALPSADYVALVYARSGLGLHRPADARPGVPGEHPNSGRAGQHRPWGGGLRVYGEVRASAMSRTPRTRPERK